MTKINSKLRSDLDAAHLSTLKKIKGLEPLLSYINEDINTYIVNVLLDSENDIHEDKESIIDLINHPKISVDILENLIQKVDISIDDLSIISNKDSWGYLLDYNFIEADWDNVLLYVEGTGKPLDEYLTRYLNDKNNYIILSTKKINYSKKFDETIDIKISRAIVSLDKVDESALKYLAKSIPYWYTDIDLSILSSARIGILARTTNLKFTADNANAMLKYASLKDSIYFIARYYDKYLEIKEKIALPIEATNELLNSSIDNKHKQELINNLNYDHLETKGLANTIYKLSLDQIVTIPFELIDSLFSYLGEKTKKIELLISNAQKLNKEQISSLLNKLGTPYSNIHQIGNSHVLLPKDHLHESLSNRLKAVDYISSCTFPFAGGIRINLKKK